MADELTGSKPWYKSKGVWGGIAATLASVYAVVRAAAPLFGANLPDIPPGTLAMIDSLFALFGVSAGIAAAYGRVVATTTITK